MRALIALCAVALLSCTGFQRQPGDPAPSITLTIGVTIQAAHVAVGVIRTAVDARTDIQATTLSSIHEALRITDDSLSLGGTALTAYERERTAANGCQIRVALDGAVTGALQAIALAQDAGVQIDPSVPAAIGGIGSIADALTAPSCSGDAGSTQTARIHMSLSREHR